MFKGVGIDYALALVSHDETALTSLSIPRMTAAEVFGLLVRQRS
ncbi:MAG: hypothetical protein RSG23_07380 [Gordonibacter sp.]